MHDSHGISTAGIARTGIARTGIARTGIDKCSPTDEDLAAGQPLEAEATVMTRRIPAGASVAGEVTENWSRAPASASRASRSSFSPCSVESNHGLALMDTSGKNFELNFRSNSVFSIDYNGIPEKPVLAANQSREIEKFYLIENKVK